MKAQSKQSIFDLSDQFFGDLNSVVAFAVDNDITLNQEIPIDQELVVNNPVGTGNDKNKEVIVVQGLSFNNDHEVITPPIVLTAVIENDAKASLVITFDKPLNESSVPDTSAFPVSDRIVSSVNINGPVVTLGVTVDFAFGQVVIVGYTKPVSNPLEGSNGLEVESFANQAVTNNVESFYPAIIGDGNTPGFFISEELTTITKDGADRTSSFRDYLGSGHDLLQATGGNQPLWVDGDGILFNGISEFLKSLPFTYNQPEQIYIVLKQVSTANVDQMIDGNAGFSAALRQTSNLGWFVANAGGLSSPVYLGNVSFGIIRVLFNGVSSKVQVNKNAEVTGNFGSVNAGGISIGGNTTFANIKVKEAIFRKIADTAENADIIYDYLDTKYGPF